MADDAATVEQLRAEVRLLRARDAAARAEIDTLREREAATAEVLRTIASSRPDLQSVLDALAESAAHLCEAADAQILQVDGTGFQVVTSYGPLPTHPPDERPPIVRGTVTGRAVIDRQTVHVYDVAAEHVEFAEA
jgi:hypothetical protein